jgi:hypothetical protein
LCGTGSEMDRYSTKPTRRCGWVQLTPEQILQHIAIQTAVGEWLKNRKESRQWKLLLNTQ